jgi:predicted cupin superfamily sugar epimerase
MTVPSISRPHFARAFYMMSQDEFSYDAKNQLNRITQILANDVLTVHGLRRGIKMLAEAMIGADVLDGEEG